MEKLRVSLELTNNCNFRCLICPHDKPDRFTRKRGFISEALFNYAIQQCEKYADTVEFGFFGEQLLHPQYYAFLRKLKRRSFRISVNTNLSLCRSETFDLWQEIGIEDVRLSLDASCAETFNHCRPGTVMSLDGKLVADDARFTTICGKAAHWLSRNRRFPTRLVYVKSSLNQGEVRDFIDAWTPKLKKDDHLLIKQIVSYGGKIEDPLVTPHTCNIWNNKYVVIGWDGTVSPCNLDVNLDLAIGNLQGADLAKLYNSAQGMRKKTGCGRDISPCKTCVDSNNWAQNKVVFGVLGK